MFLHDIWLYKQNNQRLFCHSTQILVMSGYLAYLNEQETLNKIKNNYFVTILL